MGVQQTSSQQRARSLEANTAVMRLQGRTLVIARGLWIAGAIAVLVVFFGTLPANFAYLDTVKATRPLVSTGQLGQITLAGLRQLQALGLSVDFYAGFITITRVIFVLGWAIVGGVIFWRKSDERIALLASFALVLFPIGFSGTITVAALPPAWRLPLEAMQLLSGMSLSIFLYVFPSGQFVPRWTPWLLIGWAIEESGVTFFGSAPINPALRSLINGFLFIALLASIIVVQVYRYRKVSTPVQRQQTKWVVFGATTAILGFIATLIIGSVFFAADTQSNPLSIMIVNTFLSLFLLLIPLSIGFAILRSRLWEIDIIINRSLVYGTLSVALALVYAGSVLALQALLGGFTAGNQLAIVGSTLLIAILFQPLRRRIQSIIDRRFYRRKYDAARTLQAFNTTLRGEVDLNQLRDQLIAVVEETMQPAHVSLWLRPTDQKRTPDMSKTYDTSSKPSGVRV
jgi:hypothetical protein